jgi:hypothetical protein
MKIQLKLSEALQWVVLAIRNGKPEVAIDMIEKDLMPTISKRLRRPGGYDLFSLICLRIALTVFKADTFRLRSMQSGPHSLE